VVWKPIFLELLQSVTAALQQGCSVLLTAAVQQLKGLKRASFIGTGTGSYGTMVLWYYGTMVLWYLFGGLGSDFLPYKISLPTPLFPHHFREQGIFCFHPPIKSESPPSATDFLLSPTNEITGMNTRHTNSVTSAPLLTTTPYKFYSQQHKNN